MSFVGGWLEREAASRRWVRRSPRLRMRERLLSELGEEISWGVMLRGVPRGRREVHRPAPLRRSGSSVSGEISSLEEAGLVLGVGLGRLPQETMPLLLLRHSPRGEGTSVPSAASMCGESSS